MIPALTPTPRYREHVAAVDKRSALKNVLGALGLLLLAMLAGSLVADDDTDEDGVGRRRHHVRERLDAAVVVPGLEQLSPEEEDGATTPSW